MSVNIGINIQRSPNRINQQLREAGVLGKYPKLLLDFKDEYYLTNGGSKTLANAVTHAMTSNSVMTDGYGAELLTNGDFATGDTTGWTTNGSPTVSRGVVTLPIEDSASKYIDQSLSTVSGVTYVINLNLVDADTTSRNLRVSVDSSAGTFSGDLLAENASINADGNSLEFIFTATSSTSYFRIYTNSATNGHYTSFDNISVREMPVIKWAPHNLLTYSEQFDNAAWPKTDTTITANAAIAPDGTQTADEITHTSAAPAFSRAVSPVEDGVNYTHSVFVKYIDHQWIRIGHDSASSPFGTWFDVQNGVIGTKGSNHVSSSIEDVGNGWYKLTVEGTADGTSFSTYILLADSDGGTAKVAGTSAYIWGAHLYRSDLGGMVDNPDQPASRASYVPTTSSAKYLSRVGHHVYNGSAWANEGLLAESEARTNYATYYDDFSNAFWTKVTTTVASDDTIAPTGVEAADKITATGDFTRVTFPASGLTDSTDYLVSIYAKEDSSYKFSMNFKNKANVSVSSIFDLRNISASGDGIIQDVGNGWRRCGLKFNLGSGATTPDLRIVTYVSPITAGVNFNNGESIYIYGAQVEAGSTFSSLIPTSGSSVTRAAESFTIPSANLPWPEPNYIGSELVTNGTFDLNTAGWTGILGASLSYVAGSYGTWMRVTEDGVDGSTARAYQTITTEVGKVYGVSIDYLGGTGTGSIYINTSSNFGGAIVQNTNLDSGTNTLEFVATATTTYVIVGAGPSAGVYNDYDNISVREIDPLAVSIAIDGRATYTDSNNYNQVKMVQWEADSSNLIRLRIDTNSTATGRVQVVTKALGTERSAGTSLTYFDPDILVPYDVAGVITTTGSRGAEGGVALTDSGAMTAIADLSSTDLSLANVYMGTIGTFRVWDRDITDDGLVEATNPSLEPSLSLTFEGTGTNSFVVNDWSE